VQYEIETPGDGVIIGRYSDGRIEEAVYSPVNY